MSQPAEQIVLSEVDAELTLLGSLFSSPDAFAAFAPDIRAEWFSDPLARYLFDACLRVHVAGNRLSVSTVLAALPEDCGGMTRSQLFAKAAAAAVPASSIGGVVSIVKDRWARRTIIDAADGMKEAAVRFDADPYELAAESMIRLDAVTAHQSARKSMSIEASMERLQAMLDNPTNLRGATTGLLALDNKLNAYKAGQLYVVAGRPGMGKSAFMCSSLRRTAQSGKGVAIISLEMTAEEVSARCISDSMDTVKAPFFGNITKGLLSADERESVNVAAESFAGLPFMVDDSPRLSWPEIASRARRVKAEFDAAGFPLSVLCIDHMGLVTPSERYSGNKVAEAGEVSNGARALAKELDCCVLLLCQLSREVEKREDKRPTLSDLRWSGEIEQDAHVVAFLYREAYYLQNDADADPYKVAAARNRMEFLIRKNRNGETADIDLWCSIGHSSVRDQ
jgi:replicative DNA helicase